ncbi:vanadium-dependent haloperoxidase [Luteimonas sp. SX5]|uniref:Vanadium-dependent haloperoxidase n=1 Tax=Luteimonas galliterrae TaxID=2940486 RepID=A0ABT0MIM3_9GAMM|nr:vanadium-dependent haloperoxidase [Luteimonas galliterrae]MCL1634715.1 vanadium-dependent haloperoxidase [Luteimonas galliterrae]
MLKHLHLWLLACSVCAFSTPAFSADAITDWNEKAVALVSEQKLLPPQAERVMACVHVAMFDAVNSIGPRYRPYRHAIPATANASKSAAAAAAAATVLVGLHPERAKQTNADLAAYLAKLPQGAAKSEGIKLGREIAARTLADREKDGSAVPDAYRPKTRPGVYVPTPITASSMWPEVKPFVMTGPAQLRPPPPVSLASREWAADYNELKRLGGKNSSERSAQQTEDARFWLITGPASYYPIVRQLTVAKKMDLVDSARYMALVAIATADAYIAVFDGKYHYDFWRPITAIRNGDIDGNAATERVATWQPIDNTPMHPEYPCAHCITAAAVATVSKAVMGGADIPEVAMTSATAPGVTHRWRNLDAYADEVSMARIYAGFHYRFSTRVGQDMGRKVGRMAVQNALQPKSALPAHRP